MFRRWPLVVVPLIATPAVAGPLMMGASVGLEQSQAATDGGSELLGLFGRLHLGHRLSTQLELSRISTTDSHGNDTDVSIRQATGLVIVDLGAGPVVPIVLGGVGADQESTSYSSNTFVRAEAGLGLELRIKNGFTISADARIGTRTNTTNNSMVIPIGCCLGYEPASQLQEGEFRSIRVGLGVTF